MHRPDAVCKHATSRMDAWQPNMHSHEAGHLLLELFDFLDCLLADALTLSLASLPACGSRASGVDDGDVV